MALRSEYSQLHAALKQAGASPLQTRMAEILCQVNGLKNALTFVENIAARNTPTPVVGPDTNPRRQALVPVKEEV